MLWCSRTVKVQIAGTHVNQGKFHSQRTSPKDFDTDFNTNISNCICVFGLPVPAQVPLGVRPRRAVVFCPLSSCALCPVVLSRAASSGVVKGTSKQQYWLP
ncbi:hypothetical protein VTP01DRAFT_8165 [Rhizomucor pusillus]|uniref:uncharacterized protein n=1 Tax=Rhizomucor pusillus TaxID=4840 RepID=UPI00374252DE